MIMFFLEISELNANSEDPDQTPRYAASDLGLHCLLMSLLWDTRLKLVNTSCCCLSSEPHKAIYSIGRRRLFSFPLGKGVVPIMHVMHERNMRNKNKIICNKKDTDSHKIFLFALHGLFYSLKLGQRLSPFSIHNGEIILRKNSRCFRLSRAHAMQALTKAASAPSTAASGVFTICATETTPQKGC